MIRLHKSELNLISIFKPNIDLKPILFLFIVCFFSFKPIITSAQHSKKFKVVLDAGHGGKDPGAQSFGLKEKDVALNVSLLVGKLLDNEKDIEFIYTRKTDIFIGLRERATIANKAKADLFISIHANAVNNSRPYGTETFVLGLHRNQDNLEIAMRENQVIELEENYEEKYDGFDPKSPESYIGFSLMQEEYLDQSILLASHIQDNFTKKLSRNSRGVKQAGFLVLRETYMPSVLVELGFLTNKKENTFLKSKNGQHQLAQQISNAILDYKHTLDKNSSSEIDFTASDIPKNDFIDDKYEAKFYVQIAASKNKLKESPSNFNGLDPITRVKEGEFFKYYYSESYSHKDIQNKLLEAKDKGYKGAFIVAYLNNKKISIQEALKTQVK
jgi:N-acetylmuramoyl-L-alanine amidase